MHKSKLLFTPFLLLVSAASCGSDSDTCGANNQDEALECLGVSTQESQRLDLQGAELPKDYAPLGSTKTIGASHELFMLGMKVAPPVPVGEPEVLDNKAVTLRFADDGTGKLSTEVVRSESPDLSWSDDNENRVGGPASLRAITAADLDGDGEDQPVAAFLDPSDSTVEGVVFFERIGSGTREPVVTVPGARDVELIEGDVDGDGSEELILAVAADDAGHLFVIRPDAADRFAVIEDATKTMPRVTTESTPSMEIATGNMDRDNGLEIAVVLNEANRQQKSGVSTYTIIDDASAGFANLADQENIRVQNNGNFEAQVADVTIGDFDADGKGEIAFGGLVELPNLTCTAYQHIYLILDDAGDAPLPLAPIAGQVEDLRYIPSSGCAEVADDLPVRHVFVNAMDVDGDGVAELQANLRILGLGENGLDERFAVDPVTLTDEQGRGGSALSATTTAFATTDVNGNGRDEIIVYGQHTDEVFIWGLDGPSLDSAEFRQMLSFDTEFYNGQSRVFPIILPMNTDNDGVVLKYTDAEHKFVFTEPVIIAAVAAAPCARNIGQNIDACTTAYGVSEAQSGGVDGSVTVSASAFVSFEAKDPFFGIGVEGKSTVTASASFSAGQTYSLEESIEYNTGSIEDTVIFSTIPLDQYTYSILAHPDPELVGSEIVINLPRKPVTLQVERDFYNQSVVEGSFQVDEKVFLHTPGDLSSYPDEDDADALIDTGGLGHIGPLGELVDAAGNALGPLADRLLGRGLKTNRAITVGQGSGQTSTEIVFTESTEYRAGAEISYEKELAVSGGGVSVGGSVGGSAGAGISWGSSTSTVYRGTIGSIDESNFSENIYSVGLFTYIYNYGNEEAPQFEVVNYWVDQE